MGKRNVQFIKFLAFSLALMSVFSAGIYAHGAEDFVLIGKDSGDIIKEGGDIVGTLNNIFILAIGAAALLAVIWIAIGGLQYMGTDAWSTKEDAKGRITSAVLGLVLALVSWLILYTINPDLVKLEFPDLTAPREEIPFSGEL